MSGRCLVRATAAGVGRSAMYGGGSWDERVGTGIGGDNGGIASLLGGMVWVLDVSAQWRAAAGSDG